MRRLSNLEAINAMDALATDDEQHRRLKNEAIHLVEQTAGMGQDRFNPVHHELVNAQVNRLAGGTTRRLIGGPTFKIKR